MKELINFLGIISIICTSFTVFMTVLDESFKLKLPLKLIWFLTFSVNLITITCVFLKSF